MPAPSSYEGAVMPRMLNLRQLEAFRALMLTGTTVQAAAMLGITQPVISRLISDLEFQSGLSLFVRSGGRLRPTPRPTSCSESWSGHFMVSTI
jgi:hypothetical protein